MLPEIADIADDDKKKLQAILARYKRLPAEAEAVSIIGSGRTPDLAADGTGMAPAIGGQQGATPEDATPPPRGTALTSGTTDGAAASPDNRSYDPLSGRSGRLVLQASPGGNIVPRQMTPLPQDPSTKDQTQRPRVVADPATDGSGSVPAIGAASAITPAQPWEQNQAIADTEQQIADNVNPNTYSPKKRTIWHKIGAALDGWARGGVMGAIDAARDPHYFQNQERQGNLARLVPELKALQAARQGDAGYDQKVAQTNNLNEKTNQMPIEQARKNLLTVANIQDKQVRAQLGEKKYQELLGYHKAYLADKAAGRKDSMAMNASRIAGMLEATNLRGKFGKEIAAINADAAMNRTRYTADAATDRQNNQFEFTTWDHFQKTVEGIGKLMDTAVTNANAMAAKKKQPPLTREQIDAVKQPFVERLKTYTDAAPKEWRPKSTSVAPKPAIRTK